MWNDWADARVRTDIYVASDWEVVPLLTLQRRTRACGQNEGGSAISLSSQIFPCPQWLLSLDVTKQNSARWRKHVFEIRGSVRGHRHFQASHPGPYQSQRLEMGDEFFYSMLAYSRYALQQRV